MFALDSHCDTPSQLLYARENPDFKNRGQVDFDLLRKSGLDLSFFAMYIEAEYDSDQAFERVGRMLELTRDAVCNHADIAAFATDYRDLEINSKNGLISIMMALENGSCIGEDLARFEWLCNEGIKYITLTHNGDNQLCDAASQASTHHGLSRFGRELVSRMNDAGVLVDCAHISDESFYDVLRCSKKPVVSTHSCCRALCSHRRNMTDDMIHALASEGGVIHINFYPYFLQDGLDQGAPWPTCARVADHIEHAVQVGGIEHVGIGTDFDGIDCTPIGLENVSKLGCVFDELRRRGYSSSDIELIAGRNFLRVLYA